MRSYLLLFAAFVSVSAVADPRSRLLGEKGAAGDLAPILFNASDPAESLAKRALAKPVTQMGALLPERVYLWFYAPKNDWFFILTDTYGLTPKDPIEFLRHGSILPATLVGGNGRQGQRYVLEPDGRWRPTFKPELRTFWQFSTPERIKFVEFALSAAAPGTKPVVRPAAGFELEPDKKSATAPRLLQLDRGDFSLVKSDGQLLPHRMYGVYQTADQAWAFALTDGHAHLPKPLELVAPGTIVPATLLGGANPYENYELVAGNKWTPTKKTELRFLVVPEVAGLLKRVRFYVPPKFPAKK